MQTEICLERSQNKAEVPQVALQQSSPSSFTFQLRPLQLAPDCVGQLISRNCRGCFSERADGLVSGSRLSPEFATQCVNCVGSVIFVKTHYG